MATISIAQVINSFITNPIFWIFIIIGIVVYFLIIKRKKPDEYKGINLREAISKEQKNQFRLAGLKQKNRYLRQSTYIIGRIRRMIEIPFKMPIDTENKAKEITKDLKHKIISKYPTKIFIGLQIIEKGLFNEILAILGFGLRYFLIDKDLIIDIYNKDIIIPAQANFYDFTGWHIFSNEGEEFVSNIVYKLALENTLEAVVNNVPKNAYLEMKTAKFSAKARELTKLEKEKRKAYREEYGEIDEDKDSD